MSLEGPPLERLTRRLAETPAEFLEAPRTGDSGVVHLDAVVSDLLEDLGGKRLPHRAARRFTGPKEELARLRLVLVACWLLHDDWFREAGGRAGPALVWLRDGLGETAKLVPAAEFVTDPDRREELARSCLTALGLRPAGESDEQAADRLRALDTVARAQVVAETRAHEEWARKVREAMARKRAREAAAKAIRE